MRELAISILAICVIAFPGFSTSASAGILLDDILDTPLGSIADSGMSYVSLLPSPTGTVASIILEDAGFASTNRMGIYNAVDPSKMLELFSGSDSAGESLMIMFDPFTGEAWVDPGNKVDIGFTFGFYLDSIATSNKGGGLFYSDENLNDGADLGVEHALMFETRHLNGAISGYPDVVIGFEDLRFDSTNYQYDGDYDDMVVGVSGVRPVPEPATIMLLGLGSLSLVRRKRGLGKMLRA